MSLQLGEEAPIQCSLSGDVAGESRQVRAMRTAKLASVAIRPQDSQHAQLLCVFTHVRMCYRGDRELDTGGGAIHVYFTATDEVLILVYHRT
jgi:hypothetical protein